MPPNDDRQTTKIRETVTTTPEKDSAVSGDDHVSSSVLAARVVYYVGGALLLLLALRFVLALLGANRANPFADFIFGLSFPFVSPFFGLFNYEPTYGGSVLELGTLIAMIVYGILIAGIAKLLTLNKRNPDQV
jgi:hypothetical protein